MNLWEPTTKRQESGNQAELHNSGGLVTWLPNRVTQQCRTGYLATKQNNNSGELVTWLPSSANARIERASI
jgi:hypothetical protein